VYPLQSGDVRQIGDYALSGRLGAGGMGEVFFGRSPGGKMVAVKLIHPWFANDIDFRERFRREIEACKKVSGLHTAPVVAADPDASRPWMATAYVLGPTLTEVLATRPTLPPLSLRVLGAGLAEALQAIHAAGIIHRDLKPANILLALDGPRVIDFGIARAVDAASSVTAHHGTPGFMAPEVLLRKSPTEACDVFALGVVLAHAGGVAPFGRHDDDIDDRILNEEPELGDLDPFVRALVERCLAKSPELRPKPSEILQVLAVPDPPVRWLPAPIHDMITAFKPPSEPATAHVGALDRSRLLEEAERIARALPNEYERATALVHIAIAAGRIDPPHATRLINDAWREPLVTYLIESSPSEVGTAMGCSGAVFSRQMLTDITKYCRIATHRNMGIEEKTASLITTVAEAAAIAAPGAADQLARLLTSEHLQAEMVGKVAIAAAHTDPAWAEHVTRTITARIEGGTQPGAGRAGASRMPRWGRKRAEAEPAAWSATERPGDEVARYWAARALAEIAVGVAGVGPVHGGRTSTDPGQFARTITVGEPGSRAPSPARATVGIDRARAAVYLADAERFALGIAVSGLTASGAPAADLRAGAIAAVKSAAAQINPAAAAGLLTEAEQAARMISANADRFESLRQVALSAARVDPGRAEQIARSLPVLPHRLGEIALVVAQRDQEAAERIATAITDEYVRALVRAALKVRTDNAGALLGQAEYAAGAVPARLIEVAVLAAINDPVRAERIARDIKSGNEIAYARPSGDQYERAITGYMRSADWWRARALADIAMATYERPDAT
jgi:hypothetical protein